MHLYYVSFSRIPTEKAHGLTIVKSCEAFARQGARVTLLVPRRKTQFADLYETYAVERNFEVKYLPTLDLLRWWQGTPAFWFSYASFFVSAFFFLFFARRHNAVLYTRDAPLLTFSWLGFPAIYECHHIFSKSSLYFWLVRRARGIVTISRSLRDAFVARRFAPERLLVAPSGFDPATFSIQLPQLKVREELGLPAQEPIALYTGNFTTMGADKGIADILRALPDLPEVLFVAVGGSETDLARYQALAAEMGVQHRVRLFGYAPQKELARYQAATDVLLMPFPDTPHYRTNMSPVKMFEYMASGKPIVATNLPTITEVLTPKNALLVTPGDPRALAQGVRRLLEDRRFGESLGRAAREDSARYSWDARATRVLTFIKECFLLR
jgi:glycosyltransferase involved in cell wall biosynthesis